MEGFPIRAWDLILPGLRWSYEPQVGVTTPCGAVSTPGTTAFVPVCWNCRGMELLLVGRWHPILSRWQWVAVAFRTPRLGCPHLTGQHLLGGPPFRPSFIGVVDVQKHSRSENRTLFSTGGAGSTNTRLGFPRRARRCQPGRPSFSPIVYWSCRCMEGLLIGR